MDLDEAYQNAVDKQADDLRYADVRALPPSGTFDFLIAGRPAHGTWDHIVLPDGVHQIVYRTERTELISLNLYFNGIKVLPNGEVRLLNPQELGYFEL